METIKKILIFIIVCAFLVFCFTIQGCRTIEYVPVHHHDTTYVSKIERDSVFVRDSTYVITRNDTVYFKKYIDRFRYIDRTDTVYKSSIDTLTVIEEKIVEKEVEKKLSVIDRILIFLGLMFLILIILKIIKLSKN